MSTTSTKKRIVIIGGGISGLTAAYRLTEIAPQVEVKLLEASDSLGGLLQTRVENGLCIDQSADGFITNIPWGVDLCQRIGFSDDLIETNPKYRRAFVVHRGKLHSIPKGFLVMAPSQMWPIIGSSLLSWRGKLRLLRELFVPKRQSNINDETLASFATRRLGQEAFDRLVQPLVGGIYTADPHKLSLRATLPRFLDMEQDHGSLIRASLLQKKSPDESAARYSMFVSAKNGMASFAQAVAAKLPEGCIELNSPVTQLTRNGQWKITIGTNGREILADGVIVATPVRKAAELLKSTDTKLSKQLATIESTSCVIVSLVYRRSDIGHALDGFGFVVPSIENRKILSASFLSVKYTGRASDDLAIIRVFFGGACQHELTELPDDELVKIATSELSELIQANGQPVQQIIKRWPNSMPQYHLGHVELVDRIEQRVAAHEGLAIAGNAYRGVGIPHCIHSGELAAERLASL